MTAPVRATSKVGLNYSDEGDGPVVVLVHGWCLDGRVWTYLQHALIESGHRVVVPDLAGFGRSDAVAARTTLAEHAEDLYALLAELDVSDAVIVGFAFGAAVAFSGQDFGRVAALVSIGMPSASTAPYGRMRDAITADWPRFAARSAAAIVPAGASQETRDWLGAIYGGTSVRSALAGLGILERFEPDQLAPRHDVATYFVHAREDPIVPAAVSRACAEAHGGEYVEIDSAAHLVVLDAKAAVAAVAERAARPR